MSTVKIEYTVNVSKGGVTNKETLKAEIPEADLDYFKEKYGAKVAGEKKESKEKTK